MAGAPRVVYVEGLKQARLERLEHRSRALTHLGVKPLKVAREPQERRRGQASILIEARATLGAWGEVREVRYIVLYCEQNDAIHVVFCVVLGRGVTRSV